MSEEKDDAKGFVTEETPLRIEGEEEDEADLRYGWRTFRPRVLQRLNNPKVFVAALALYAFIQGNTVNTILALSEMESVSQNCERFFRPENVRFKPVF